LFYAGIPIRFEPITHEFEHKVYFPLQITGKAPEGKRGKLLSKANSAGLIPIG
jgi:hypothetical protein